ncbi:MAG: DUF4492 domain-containing protein [Epsilonproteobacteria bacterium]|nr:DUF4492 domain-containing protein [Campylobacterota bacterium]
MEKDEIQEKEWVIDLIKKIFSFYREGFSKMRLGKRLWLIIVIKFIIFFGIIKWLFFPNYLEKKFDNDTQRSYYILEQLTKE